MAADRSRRLEPPDGVGQAAVRWVRRHLADLVAGEVVGSPGHTGGQRAADAALAGFGVTGYAAARSQVLPVDRRGASGLSPYVRHGLVDLPRLWDHVARGPAGDVAKFRDELLWQEYARHLYARLGPATAGSLRYRPAGGGLPPGSGPWDGSVTGLACVDAATEELDRDGWLVNQARMWLASYATHIRGGSWVDGERWMFARLLDGSRAANRLGWQWVSGAATGRRHVVGRAAVQRYAPGLCDGCALASSCPLEAPVAGGEPVEAAAPAGLGPGHDPEALVGPRQVVRGVADPAVVWLTAESLGDADPALAANPGLPAVFVFDERLLAGLGLAGPRLVFVAETLADLATRREVEVWRGDPVAVLAGRPVAATFTPVPGWRRRAAAVGLAEVHPWRWLVWPAGGSLRSYSAWRRATVPARPSGQ